MKNKFVLTILFWIFCGIVFLLNDSVRIIRLRPQSVHVWRQTDCTSYTLNYYQNDQPLFEPQTHTLLGKNGHTVSEFPILYYLTAKLYHVLGPGEWILRGINFLLFLFGCTCLLWCGFELLKNKWLAFIPSIIMYTSPYLYYYALNYLPDVPALSMAISGMFFSFRFFNTKKLYWAYLSALFFCFGMLLKISAGISFVAVSFALLFVIYRNGNILVQKKHYPHLIFLFLVTVIVNAMWVEYAMHYNYINGTRQNLLGIFPLWEADINEIRYIGHRTLTEWSLVILHPLIWIWISLLLLVVIWKRKCLTGFFQLITLLMVLGLISYSILWYRAYLHHDYYMINPFVVIIWVILMACVVVDKSSAFLRVLFFLCAIVIIPVLIHQCHKVQLMRYANPTCNSISESLLTIESYLRSIGISRHDRIVSIPDPSANITLYYMNQPGWTELFSNSDYPMKRCVDSGAKYLVVSDTNLLALPKYSHYLGTLIGVHKEFRVYSIRQ